MASKMNFEDKLKKLEKISESMETGDMPLEDSLKSYEQAMLLIKDCEDYISDAKLRIEKVTNGEIKEVK